jgi:hypothetical protein
MRATLRLAAIAAIALVTLTACAGTVPLTPATHATSAGCAGIVAQLPQIVSSQSLPSRETNAQGTGAWGDPATVLLRCGVPVPDPTSTLVCITVDGIDWLRDDGIAPDTSFTTYGRNPATTVVIDSKVDGNSTLTDLAPAIGSVKAEHHCLDPSDVLQGGDPVEATPTPTP